MLVKNVLFTVMDLYNRYVPTYVCVCVGCLVWGCIILCFSYISRLSYALKASFNLWHKISPPINA